MREPRRDFITVVCGVPRSGTSLVMQMLGAGGMPLLTDGVRGADVHNPRGYFEYEPAKRLRSDASWVSEAQGKAVKLVHAVVSLLPAEFSYRLLLVRRDLREVVASQQAMLGERYDPDAGPSPARLVEIFGAQLAELERWLAARPEFRVSNLEHRSLLEDPKPVAAEMAGFLGGGLDVGAMVAAVDPALQRRRAGD
jgi:hypothetical protein